MKKQLSAVLPADYTPDQCHAVYKLSIGEATPEQQLKAFDWIINNACMTYDLAFRSGGLEGDRDTAFASGRQFAGQQIIKMTKVEMHRIINEQQHSK